MGSYRAVHGNPTVLNPTIVVLSGNERILDDGACVRACVVHACVRLCVRFAFTFFLLKIFKYLQRL
jgi:hypothetical protein